MGKFKLWWIFGIIGFMDIICSVFSNSIVIALWGIGLLLGGIMFQIDDFQKVHN